MTGRCDVLVRCDGGAGLGLGHVKRCLGLAKALETLDLAVAFAGRYDEGARAVIADAGVRAVVWPQEQSEAAWLQDMLQQSNAHALVLDIRTELPQSAIRRARESGVVTLLIDDASERRLAADIVALPPTPAAETLSWQGYAGEALVGWRWILLPGSVPRAHPNLTSRGKPPLRLLVTMGGADPFRLTERAARALVPCAAQLAVRFVIGPSFADAERCTAAVKALWPAAEIAFKPPTLGPIIQHTDIALVSYGVTALELAAAGVPALYLCISDDHAGSARALAATGAGLTLGRHETVSDAALREAVSALVADPGQRAAMTAAGPKAIDGKGAERLAACLFALIERAGNRAAKSRAKC